MDVITDVGIPVMPAEHTEKVRKWLLPNGKVVYAKRIDPLRMRYPEEEIVVAQRVGKRLNSISLYFHTQEFIGIVYDQGVFYLLSLAVPESHPSFSPGEKISYDEEIRKNVRQILETEGAADAEPMFWLDDSGKIHCTFIDFETFPYPQEKQINTASSALGPEKEEISFASPAVENKKGGVDFRALPIITEPITGSPQSAPPQADAPTAQVRSQQISGSLNLDEEWAQIQNMLNAGIIPSSQRLKEFLEASCESSGCAERIEDALGIIADILRLEEERAAVTEPALRELLVLLESDKPADELQLALSKITVLPKIPQRN